MDFYDYAWDYCEYAYLNTIENPYVICLKSHDSCNEHNCPNRKCILDFIDKYNKENHINDSFEI